METQDRNLPGFTLRYTLRGHTEVISHIAWSPRDRTLASVSQDGDILLWDVQTGQTLQTFRSLDHPYSIDWSPDGQILAIGSQNKIIRLWKAQTGELLRTLSGHSGIVRSLAWSPNRKVLASGSSDRTIFFWDTQTWQRYRQTLEHYGTVNSLAWSPNGQILASGSEDQMIRLWDAGTRVNLLTLNGHSGTINRLAWSPSGGVLASSSSDKTICLWNPDTGQRIHTLEGHTGSVISISFSNDGQFLASGSLDGTMRIWHTDTWKTVNILEESAERASLAGLAFHPNAPILATLDEKDRVIHIWEFDTTTLLRTAPASSSVHYTTFKIALVGDSGVGKTGLGYRIAEDRFLATESTHGQQFWVVDKLSKTREDGTQCEVVLWDFAGQPNFRPIHALFLDDVDLALILFDSARHDTLTGVDYWLKQLSYLQQPCCSVLVAGRIDVSMLTTSPAELEAFCLERKIRGGFVMTSAKTREGIDALLETIHQQTDWSAKPATVTTEAFKRIKDYVLMLKADAGRKNVLCEPRQLYTQIQRVDPNWQFTEAEMMTAVDHLQNHGYVIILRGSSGKQCILLVPDLLINLAARYMLKAQLNEKGLGALEESQVLSNMYRFPEVEHLSDAERGTLLTAVIELFLSRNICFRESVDNRTFLIFPSLIFDRPPHMIEDAKLVEDTTYIVTGLVENVYPALVVLLGYAPNFQRINQWHKQAQYETIRGDICGFKLVNDDPGELELLLYYGRDTADFEHLRFQGLFEEILSTHQVNFKKYRPVFCPDLECHRQQERRTVIKRVQEGKKFLHCEECGAKINLVEVIQHAAFSLESRALSLRDQALSKMRTSYETAIVQVKRFIQERKDTVMPTCFVSYAWGNPVQERWVLKLTDDLRKADIEAILDQLDNAVIGSSLTRFISRIEQDNFDFVLVVGTPAYRQKYENQLSQYGSVVAAEVDLINVRLTGTEAQKATVLPLLLEGEEHTSFPPLLHRRVYGNFKHEEEYFVTLFDLVLTLHHIPFNNPVVRDLRTKLREEARTLIKTY